MTNKLAAGGLATMPRKLRLEFPDACYHVINRGNYRRDLFAAKGAAESFEQCLFEASARFGWRLHAFAIMRNHFHLAVETPEVTLQIAAENVVIVASDPASK